MKNVYICLHNPCELRSLDATRIRNYLSKNNYNIVIKPENADIIIFVSCAVVNRIAEESLQWIKKFQKYDAELIVAGCLPEMEKEKLSKIFKGKTILTKNLDKIDKLFPEHKIEFKNIEDGNILFRDAEEDSTIEAARKTLSNIRLLENTYNKIKEHIAKNLLSKDSFFYNVLIDQELYHIRISWGCSCNCSFCTIPKAVGPHKSKPLDQCIQEFKKGLDKGYKRFVITADDISLYGLDIGSSFPDLLDKITKIPGEYEISIRGIHPRWVVKYLNDLEVIFQRKKIVRLGIPIQSGSDRILKLMNRYSDTEKMKEAFVRLKEEFPNISLHTHYLLGFPTETEEDVKQTLRFITDIGFNAGFIYPFSCKTGSEAEKIEPKIPEEKINERLLHSKKFLKKNGYKVIYLPSTRFFGFERRI